MLKSTTSIYPRIPLCLIGPCEGKPCPPVLLPIIWRRINAAASGPQRQECQCQMNPIRFLITTQFSQCHLFKFPPRLRRPTAIRQTCSSQTRSDSLSSSVLLVRRVIKAEGCDRGSESRSGFSYLKILWSAGCMSRDTWWRRWGCSWGMRNRWEDSWRREQCHIYLQHAAVFGVSRVWKEKWGMIVLQFVAFRCPETPGKAADHYWDTNATVTLQVLVHMNLINHAVWLDWLVGSLHQLATLMDAELSEMAKVKP